jgi:hypothetical protein
MGIAKTSDGKPIYALEKSDATKITLISHDWTDPTTWYETSIRIADETVANSGDNQRYLLAHLYIIDTYHGKVSREDYLKNADGYSYRVEVKVNDIIKAEQDPHFGTGGDYTINYKDGYIDFLEVLGPTDEVKAIYHYMVDSTFTVKPDAGKNIKIVFVEVQFSQDVVLNDSIIFQPYGLVDVFAPQLMPGVPSGTKIPLGNPTVYKTMTDYQNDAAKSYPIYPVMGGAGWRAASQPIVIFDWDYVSSTVVKSAYGMEVKVKLQHDTAFGGWYATASFYCISE